MGGSEFMWIGKAILLLQLIPGILGWGKDGHYTVCKIAQATFLVPKGKCPLAVNLSSMGKGQAWVNGQSIGRYWPAYHSPSTGCSEKCDYKGSYSASKCLKYCGQPAQTLYHIPHPWVHPGENLLVLHEELGGDPSRISFSTRAGQEICAHVSEFDPLPADSWKLMSEYISQTPQVRLACEKEDG